MDIQISYKNYSDIIQKFKNHTKPIQISSETYFKYHIEIIIQFYHNINSNLHYITTLNHKFSTRLK